MFLAFPLDYQVEGFMKAAVAPFGRVLFWRQCWNKSVSLVHCLLLDPSRVPRSVVLSQGTTVGPNNRSWSIPTYILGGNIGMEIGDEDPIPVDGNPHPPQGAPMAGNPNIYQNWLHDHVGAAAQVLADAGIGPQLMQEINDEVHDMMQAQAQAQMNQDPNLDDVLFQEGVSMEEDMVPQHFVQPKDTLTFVQSGSTAGYLRATGPDIHLTVEEVLAAIQREENNASDSDDSGVVTSVRMTNLVVPDFIVKACQRIRIADIIPSTVSGKKK